MQIKPLARGVCRSRGHRASDFVACRPWVVTTSWNKPLAGLACGKQPRPFRLNKITGPLRRALIYGAVSYGGLVLINNSELNLPNMWIAYLPMFVGVYLLTQWLDRKFGS